MIHSIERSYKLLEAMWSADAEKVAEGIDKAHQEVSILQYNDENAVKQIKERKYTDLFEGHSGALLLVGISYDKETKRHHCRIERV